MKKVSSMMSSQEIERAEEYFGRKIVNELKDRVKKEIYLTNEYITEGDSKGIKRCCINFPDGYEKITIIITNWREGYSLERLAMCENIVKWYSYKKTKTVDFGVGLTDGIEFVIKTHLISDEPYGEQEKHVKYILKHSRQQYYQKLLGEKWNEMVDSLDMNEVHVIKSEKIDKLNESDF